MDKAMRASRGKEQAHPALAVEGARVRLNLASVLSADGRGFEEVVQPIKEAQNELANVIAWAEECEDDDPGVGMIAEEARALQCAALMAEGIALEQNRDAPLVFRKNGSLQSEAAPGEPASPSGGGSISMSVDHLQFYEDACTLAESRLPRSHPAVGLARKLRADAGRAVCAAGAPGGAWTSQGSEKRRSRPRGVSLPRLGDSGGIAQDTPESYNGWTSLGDTLGGTRSDLDVGGGGGVADDDDEMEGVNSDANTLRASQRRRPNRSSRGHRDDGRKKEKPNIFAEFIRDAEAELEARSASKETWQEDARRRLKQIHRSTKLLLDLSEDVELKDKKYTNNGHKVMMQSFLRDNRSRSDPSLVREARRAGASPEVHQVKKYNKDLYVKPPTPPPVKKEEKPKVDESIASLFARPKQAPDPLQF